MISKKAQIFIFDFILSIVILIISIGIILSYFNNTTENVDVYDLNHLILDGFTKTKINSLNDEEIRLLFVYNKIQNIENTIAQQASEFYYEGDLELAQNVTRIFVSDFITNQMNVNITLSNSTFNYNLYEDINKRISFDDAEIASVTNRLIIGYINDTAYYGPFNIEVRIWQ